MVLKLYGYTLSPPSKLVATILHEKEIPFEYISVDLMTGKHKAPEYVTLQPFGQVPCIDDNGFVLYESHAICRYLEETYPNQGSKLIPSDPKKRALFDQAASVATANFDRHAMSIGYEVLFKKLSGGEADVEKVKQSTEALSRNLDVYEKILSKQKYIAGDELTLADLYHLPVGTLLPQCGVNLSEGRPNFARWFNEISSRPAWQKVKDGLGKA